ncbi:MAG: VCBS repeat-containing protein [Bryobacteraceae bacterium]
MTLRLLVMVGFAGLSTAAPPRFTQHIVQRFRNENVNGFVLEGRTLVTWGERLLWRSLPEGNLREIRGRGRAFSEGGCLLDVNGDGFPDVVVNEGGPGRALVWFDSRSSVRHVIDSGLDAPDMIPATLFGRRGVLLIHKRIQLRFYEVPSQPESPWSYQEVYSFYSPSRQGGLRMADVDGDGMPDILAGNYWVRSPKSFEMPWRLFAIEPWNEEPGSAMLRLIYGPLTGSAPELLITQREIAPARLSRFEKPADPRQLWIEHRIESVPDLDEPAVLDVADFDVDGHPDILVAERAGKCRLMILRNDGTGAFTPLVIANGTPMIFGQASDIDGDGRPDIVTLRGDAISWWQNQPPPPETR